MPNDKRKMIKWQPFQALPEHQKAIKEAILETKKEQQPLLSEDKEEEINYVLQESLFLKKEISIIYFENGLKKKVTGKIKKIENGNLYFYKNTIIIPLKNIINIVE